MDKDFAEARAEKWLKLDKRLSYDTALSEALMEQVILDLDSKGRIPKSRIVDKKP